uniref:Major facilitator superfamily (MFS) profile domain-containing protein n=1 Tax=Acrobeloides nanus TaxID=290746 RepID=A0A914ENH3_9BILA
MTKETSNLSNNATTSDYNYSPVEQGWLFSIIAVGQIFGTFVLSYGLSKFDIRKSFAAFGLISAIATLLTPLSAYIGFVPLLFMRFLQGFATSTSFAGIGSITQQWSTIKESGMFLSLLSCHLQIGSVFTMPVAGLLCESQWGWPALYYLQGGMTTVAFIAFYIFYRDDPYWHGLVSDKELSRIERGKISVSSRETKTQAHPPKVPYKAIFTDKVVWGVIIGIAGVQFGFCLFVQYGPVYMNKVCVDQPRLVRPCLVSLAFSGLNAVGSMKASQMMSQHFAYVLMNVITIISSFIILVLPMVIAILAPDNTHSQWSVIFIGVSMLTFTGLFIFLIFVEVEPRPWVKNSGVKNQVFQADIQKMDVVESKEKDAEKLDKNEI